MAKCNLCPRKCGVDREHCTGFCRVPAQMTVARAALHHWEEPCISGTGGSGTIFFSGCSLGCVFCQNREISRGGKGKTVDKTDLQRICFSLKEQGAHNINLVTPMHYAPAICDALLPIKEQLAMPIVCNTGGYDSTENLETIGQIVDCYLPDFKFADADIANRFCRAPDYPEVALHAISAMVAQKGKPKLDGDGLMQRGVLVRHLILPGCRKDSLRVLELLAETVGCENILLSLMSQYTPQQGAAGSLSRRITEFEYRTVLEHALQLGFTGYMQDRTSASAAYTPAFDLTGVL